MNELILPPEPKRSGNDASVKKTIEITIEPEERRSAPRRQSSVAGIVLLAGLVGAGAYAFHLSRDAMTKLPQAPAAQAAGPEATQRQIAALEAEVRDLRAKLDAVEKRQPAEAAAAPSAPANAPAPGAIPQQAQQAPDASKPAPTPSDYSGATTNTTARAPAVATAAQPAPAAPVAEAPVTKVAPTPPKIVPGYRLREAFGTNAVIQSRRGVIDVQPGDVLPDAGRVLAIQKRAGRWVVATEGGDIVGETRAQPRPPAAPRRRPVYRERYGYEPGPLVPPFYIPF